MAKTRLTWAGNLRAQKAADEAFAKLKPKKKPPKKRSAFKQRKIDARKARRLARKNAPPPKPFVRPNYYEYIVSEKWRRKRAKFIAAVGGKCETCGATHGLQVHHRHYRTLGQEGLQDVEILCGGCHTQEHEPDGVTLADPVSAQFRAILA